MGDRVLMQCIGTDGDYGPVVYGHNKGGSAKEIVARLAARMEDRKGDIGYASARLVQEMVGDASGSLSFGLWNAEAVLTAADSHGDAGVVLINVDKDFEATYLGGYL